MEKGPAEQNREFVERGLYGREPPEQDTGYQDSIGHPGVEDRSWAMVWDFGLSQFGFGFVDCYNAGKAGIGCYTAGRDFRRMPEAQINNQGGNGGQRGEHACQLRAQDG